MNASQNRWYDGLLLAQLLSILLLLLSYLRILGDSQSMEFRDYVLETLFAGPIWGTRLGDNLLFFAFGVVLMHVVYGLACWVLGKASAVAWPSADASRHHHILAWFLLLTGAVLANNAATFVTSSLGEPYAEAMNFKLFGINLGRLLLVAVGIAAAATVVMAGVRWWRLGGRLARRSYVPFAGLAAAYVIVSAYSALPAPAQDNFDKPNVILIGLDSLRDDLVDERLSPHVTPHLASFMREATWFSNAITPLARTFPSMCSMLTGRSPHHSGAVMNLLPRQLVDDSESLPRILARAGYHATYATDEVRFSNIDTSYGFAQAITPPIGASEFLLGKLDDTPVTNLLLNTRLGQWLFPFAYANRGAAVTYDPDTFVGRIDSELKVDRPLFLTLHLTLTHWPYIWAGAPIKSAEPKGRWPEFYLNAAHRVDRQLGDILAVLDKKGLLKNAIVVIYSDHGESFDVPYDALVREDDALIESLGIVPTWGHGTSILATHQFRIVLGVRRYGATWPAPREIRAPVSFEDIAPTIVEALGAETSARFDGLSLFPLLTARTGAEQPFDGRIRFTESEYQLPPGFATQDGNLSLSKVREATAVYSYDRTTDRIEVKQSRLGQLLLERQYAAVGDGHLVAAFPNKTGPGFNILAVPLSGGAPRQLLAEPPESEAELAALWRALHSEFGDVLESRVGLVATPAVAIPQRTIPQRVTN